MRGMIASRAVVLCMGFTTTQPGYGALWDTTHYQVRQGELQMN